MNGWQGPASVKSLLPISVYKWCTVNFEEEETGQIKTLSHKKRARWYQSQWGELEEVTVCTEQPAHCAKTGTAF